MMNSPLIIGTGAGLVSAVLFASTAGGTWLAVLLFYLAPLPGFLAGLGWGWHAALIAGASGSVVVLAALGIKAAAVFVFALAIPFTTLTYLALLSRTGVTLPDQPPAQSVEWYPLGRLVAWAAVIAGALSAISIPLLGFDSSSYRDTVVEIIESALLRQIEAGGAKLDREQIKPLLQGMAYAMPAASAIFWLGVMLMNMWTAGRIALMSDRLARPWPDIHFMSFPPFFPLALAAAFLLSFLPGIAGIASTGIAGAFFFAYFLLGLTVIHVLLPPTGARPLILTGLYMGLFILGWIGLIIAFIGLAEPLFNLRQRALNRAGHRPPGGGGPGQ
ncbi:MAG: DUF2232 domain-containing protein [Pseudomonadota bacterium]|nr:DUF2232 domain-containing protein [Pseudomonadota bacterium]